MGELTNMKFKRNMIGENIGFSSVIDEKFNTCSVSVRFITGLSAETAAANSIAVGVMSASNSRLKTLAELNERLSELYGAGLSTFSRKRGDLQILGFSSSWICNRFALDSEDITGGMSEIIRDCIFSPNVSGGGFDQESFKITQKDLLDRIDAELNDKRGYAISKAGEIAFRGEPAENSCHGTRESAEAVTAQSAYDAYRLLMETAHIEITFIAPEENEAVAEMFRQSFASIARSSGNFVFRAKSPVKPSPENISEVLDVRQSKIVLTFKSDSDDLPALKMFSVIFGETPVSKLFMNVREKLSLCYYCACRMIESKNAVTVDCGVEKANIEKASEEILRQLDEIKNGNITDEELESAFLTMDNALSAVGDTPASYSGWYFERLCCGDMKTPAERYEELHAVTKERIIAAAASMKLDSTYYMLNKETAE